MEATIGRSRVYFVQAIFILCHHEGFLVLVSFPSRPPFFFSSIVCSVPKLARSFVA